MDRPISIVKFERCYLAAFAVGVVNTILSWQRTLALTQQQAQMFGTWFMPALTALAMLIPLLLWYFIARKGSAVAKWIVVVLFGLNVIGLLISLGMGTYAPGVSGFLGIVGVVLHAVAIWFLFRPDTSSWFGEPAIDDMVPEDEA